LRRAQAKISENPTQLIKAEHKAGGVAKTRLLVQTQELAQKKSWTQ
jgi:hypothetical protein